jgi:hypothetical protein
MSPQIQNYINAKKMTRCDSTQIRRRIKFLESYVDADLIINN